MTLSVSMSSRSNFLVPSLNCLSRFSAVSLPIFAFLLFSTIFKISSPDSSCGIYNWLPSFVLSLKFGVSGDISALLSVGVVGFAGAASSGTLASSWTEIVASFFTGSVYTSSCGLRPSFCGWIGSVGAGGLADFGGSTAAERALGCSSRATPAATCSISAFS